jgi:hypothetical protein
MRLILPKTQPALEGHKDLPMFFLAGPIRGGGDWHASMSRLLMGRFGRPIVVNPSRYDQNHPHAEYRMRGEENRFERQTDWERHYLEQAAEKWPAGCIIFWLAEQKEPRQDGGPYARDTYGEIGEWRGRMMRAPHLRVVVGAEKEFPGLSQIKRNFELALPDLKIYDTMEEVVERAAFFAEP